MRKILIFLFCFAFSIRLSATEPGWMVGRYDHLVLYEVYNTHCQYDDAEDLYVLGIAELLNAYINELINKGKLKNKMFIIHTGNDYQMPHPRSNITVTSSPAVNYIETPGSPDITFLTQVINYFTSQEWQSYVYDSGEYCPDKKTDLTYKNFVKRLDKIVGKPDMGFYSNRKAKVYETGDLRIYFYNGELHTYIGKEEIDIKLWAPLPVHVGNKYMIASEYVMYVYEGTKLINKRSFLKSSIFCDLDDFELETRGDRINLFYDQHLIIHSYSAKANQFYKIKNENWEEFLNKFSLNDTFQLSRVMFPLNYFHAPNKDSLIVYEKEDWKSLFLLDKNEKVFGTEYFRELGYSFEKKLLQLLEVKEANSDLRTYYFFRNYGGKWFLEKIDRGKELYINIP